MVHVRVLSFDELPGDLGMQIFQKALRRLGFTLVHSQEGEDLVLGRLLSSRRRGFYLDVGGHHPWRFSNTALLYDRGWHGLVIEPNPSMWFWFRLLRRRDDLVRCAVGRSAGFKTYFRFRESALNTMDSDLADQRSAMGFRMLSSTSVPVRTIDDILETHAIDGRIHLVSIDVEGFELEALAGFDVPRWKPEVICLERIGVRMGEERRDSVLSDLLDVGYAPYAKLLHSWILVDLDSDLWESHTGRLASEESHRS